MQEYEVRSYLPGDLGTEGLSACIAIVKRGEAVDPDSATREIPIATLVAVVTKGGEIVGVGVIKRMRRDYAATIARRSATVFQSDTRELGYVAIDPPHRGHHLSSRVVTELLSNYDGPLFATTDNDRMKCILDKAGFVRSGQEWAGNKGRLSLWLKD